ncbi:MAG: hypothetical protein KF708_11950 [Pirellulales bacterium]|nr:hypothetical protein [Pirellulales bacterium]
MSRRARSNFYEGLLRGLVVWLAVGAAWVVAWPAGAAPPTAVADEADSSDAAQATPAKTKFLRVTRDEDGKLVAMETAIVRYVPADEDEGIVVDLVAAVHIAEPEYFDELNDVFANYDAVLYELVAPEDAKPKPGERSGHPIAMLQGGMQNMLELTHQLDGVDYERKNFVHADMSPEAFEQSMRDRNENMFSMFFRMLGHSIAQQSLAAQRNPGAARQSDAGMLLALMNPDRAMSMRQLMAEQFENMDGMIGGLDGPKGSTLISERNKVAIDVLQRELASGKKKLAIFYGAGHMRDLEQRLVDELGMKLDSERWLVAWKLKRDKQNEADKKK